MELTEILILHREIELKAAELYEHYSSILEIKEDRDFFWRLSQEEILHASIFNLAIRFAEEGILQENIFHSDVNDLKSSNKYLSGLLNLIKNKVPLRYQAFQSARLFENSIGEIQYLEGLKLNGSNYLVDIFRNIDKQKVNHNDQLDFYIQENKIGEIK